MIYINDHLDTFDLEKALPLLSEQRRAYVLRYKPELSRKTCAAAYLLLCEGLRQEYGIIEKPIFQFETNGKPFLPQYPHIFFNLSHCKEAAACVISNQPVGIDIEAVSNYKESLARATMNDEELEFIFHQTRPDIAFTELWTKKEALLKCTGEGLRNDMTQVLINTYNIKTVVSPDNKYVYSVAYTE